MSNLDKLRETLVKKQEQQKKLSLEIQDLENKIAKGENQQVKGFLQQRNMTLEEFFALADSKWETTGGNDE